MPKVSPFVNLHVHTDKSDFDGMSQIRDLARLAAEDGAPALAVTNHKNVSEVVQLFKACNEFGLKAIPGIEGYFIPEFEDADNFSIRGKKRTHIINLAYSDEGYSNLVKMSSLAYLNKLHHGKFPISDWELLEETSKGLIGTTACVGGYTSQAILDGNIREAYEHVSDMADIYGKGNYFIEVQNHGIKDELKVLPELVKMSKKLKLPLVAAGDSHYTSVSDAKAHDALISIRNGERRSNEDRFKFATDTCFYHTAELAHKLFPESEFPGAIKNTLLIAERVQMTPPTDHGHLLPQYKYLKGAKSSEEAMRRDVYKGLRKIYAPHGGDLPPDVIERAEMEIGVIAKLGFCDYFLIMADIINWCKSRAIPVGPGRGSAAGSLVSYALGIVAVDPLKHGLYFERFLNPDRSEMPDIDVDIDSTRRAEVFAYIAERFGDDRVAQICTWNRLQGLGSIGDSARFLGVPSSKVPEIKEFYPRIKDSIPLKQMLSPAAPKGKNDEESEKLKKSWSEAKDLRSAVKKDSELREVYEVASSVEGHVRSIGKHAAGILITPDSVWKNIPVFDVSGDGGIPRSQYDKKDVEAVGGLKLDMLSLSNLSIVERCSQIILETTGKSFDPYALPKDDRSVYDMLRKGECDFVFQVSSPGMRQLLNFMQVDNFDEVSAALALYRPGPMGSDIHNEFCRRKIGQSKVVSLHPKMSEILGDTYSVLVYQEQVMRLSQEFAGFSGPEADRFRSAMGKKNPKVMEEVHAKFVEGCKSSGYTESLANAMWNQIEPFSGYAFNRCVSGSTRLQVGAANHHTDGYTTVEELYRRIYGITSKGGRCAACDSEPATHTRRDVPLCSRCFVWRKTFIRNGKLRKGYVQTLSMSKDGLILLAPLKDVHYNGVRTTYRISLANGMSIDSTENHRHRSESGWKRTDELNVGDKLLTVPKESAFARPKTSWVGIVPQASEIVSIEYVGEEAVYDVEMDDDEHNWVGNGIVTHNSHTVAYAYITYATAYMKVHYTPQYLAAVIDSPLSHKKPDELNALIQFANAKGIQIYSPDINKSNELATTMNGNVWLGFDRVSGCNWKVSQAITSCRSLGGDFTSLGDFINRMCDYGVTSRPAFQGLIHAGAFDHLHKSRKAMSEHVDEILALAKKSGSDEDSTGIFDLFADDRDDFTNSFDEFNLDDDEYSTRTKRSLEFDSLGMFTGTHPYVEIKPLISALKKAGSIPDHAVASDSADVMDAENGDKLSVYGILSAVEEKVSKKNKRGFTKFTIETMFGQSLSCIAWKTGVVSDSDRGSLVLVQGSMRVSFQEAKAEEFLSDDSTGDDGAVESSGATEISYEKVIEMVANTVNSVNTDLSEKAKRRSRLTVVEEGGTDTPRRRGTRSSSTKKTESAEPETYAPKKASGGSLVASRRARINRARSSSESAPEKPVESKKGQENVVRLADVSRITFVVSSKEQMADIADELYEIGPGAVTVRVKLNDKTYAIGDGWAISRRTARGIANSYGVKMLVPKSSTSKAG